jgi:murein DD-endopeptidase MepM/ murein hydrolase activator NlpD
MAAPLTIALIPGLATAGSLPPRALAVIRVEGRRRALFELRASSARIRDGEAVLGRFDGDGPVLFVEMDLPNQTRRLTIEADGETSVLNLPVGDGPMLGPPLRGGPWAAIYKAQWPRGHRRVFYDGRLPGRTAIDWVKLDDQGRVAAGDPDLARDALGYGADVLAVADAVVAAARDGVPEAERVSRNGKHPQDLAAGNYVSLDLGGGRFAVCEHLIPGSVAVKVGDRVRKGQVIGRLGFSGDSTGPHLHFHVADAAAPLVGEGVGYGFERFTLLGRYEDISRVGSAPWTPLAGLAADRRNELPDSNVVVRFPD